MGRSAGPGSPLSFQCWKCRKQNWHAHANYDLNWRLLYRGRSNRVKLTGKTKKRATCPGLRHGDTLYQYECLDCGHVGYSSHYDLESLYRKRTKEQLPKCCNGCEYRDETQHDPPCIPGSGDEKNCSEWNEQKR